MNGDFILKWALVALGVFIGSVGALLLKLGASRLSGLSDGGLVSNFFNAAMSPIILGGIVLYVIPTGIWIWLLRTMPLTVLQPALSLTYVVSALLAVFFLNEAVSMQRWIGIIVIVVGVTIVARS